MPRLPDIDALGARPTPQSNRPIVGYKAGQEGDALAATGGALMRAGGRAIAVEQAQADKLQSAYAESALLKGQLDALDALKGDADYGTYGLRYDEAMGKARAGAEAIIEDPDARALFGARADLMLERGRAQVRDLAFAREKDTGQARLYELLDQNTESYLKAPDEATRALTLGATNDALRAAREKNYISAEEETKARIGFTGQANTLRFRSLPLDERARLLPHLAGQAAAPSDSRAAIDHLIDATEGTSLVPMDGKRGASKFGINQAANPDVDVPNLTRERATQLYKSRYWDAIGADSLPEDVRYMAFDTAVNFGVGTAKSMLAESGGDPAKLAELRKDKHAALVESDPKTYGKYAAAWAKRDAAAFSPAMAPGRGDEWTGFIPAAAKRELATRTEAELAQRENARVRTLEAERKLRAEDPIAFAQTQGLVGTEPLDFADPAVGDRLQERAVATKTVSRVYGSPEAVFTRGEAQAFTAHLDTLPADRQLGYLATLKDSLGDVGLYQTALQQIRPDSPVTAMAGMYLGLGDPQVTQSRWFGADESIRPEAVAQRLLEGEALLNPTKGAKQGDGKSRFPVPADAGPNGLRMGFNDYVGDAFRGMPQAQDQAYQAFRAFYAAEAARQGDYSGLPNPEIASLAAKAVVGTVADTNGRKVVAPWGMDETTFRDRAKTDFDRAVADAGIPNVGFGDATLENTGEPGLYRAVVGSGYLMDGGRPLVVRVE